MIDLEKTFKKFDNDFLKFELIDEPLNPRPDLAAFLLLDKLTPPRIGTTGKAMYLIGAAEHDEIWIDIDCDQLAEIATESDIITLIRCGIRYDGESLCMFV